MPRTLGSRRIAHRLAADAGLLVVAAAFALPWPGWSCRPSTRTRASR